MTACVRSEEMVRWGTACPAGDRELDLSVVIVTPDCYGTIRRTMRYLRAQTIRDRIEIVIVAPSCSTLDFEEAQREGFFRVRLVEIGEIRVSARARAAGARAASAPVVAFAEDHCFPAPDWAEALIAAHRQGWAAVGPAMVNANPRSPISRASFLLNFGRWSEPEAMGEIDGVPWHNTSYKRDLLIAFGDELADLLEVEGLLHVALRAGGQRLYLEPAAETRHLNPSRLASHVVIQLLGGCLFAAARAHREGWSRARRLLHAGGAPLVPLVRLWRLRPELRRLGRGGRPLSLLPPLAVGLAAHAVGELIGSLFGAPEALRARRSALEFHPERHLVAQDVRAEAERDLREPSAAVGR